VQQCSNAGLHLAGASRFVLSFVSAVCCWCDRLGLSSECALCCWRRAGNLETALDITVKVLPAFESLFGIPYTLPKLDLIGIPDFAAGAMENWGLITYRETALLIDPQHASLPDLRSVAYIIAHEMTHQVSVRPMVPHDTCMVLHECPTAQIGSAQMAPDSLLLG